MHKFIFSALVATLISTSLYSQKQQIDSADRINYFSADFAYHIPQYDMSKWFYNSATIGATYCIKTSSNWTFGLDVNYLWGDQIKNKDSVLKNITNSDGNIIDGNGQYAIINYTESGWTGTFTVGKVFPLTKKNQNSGLWIKGGIGFLQHKILITNPKNVAPQIKDDYKKGYDQLANGLSCSQFIGYLWISKRSAVNAYAGFEIIEGWTKSRRTTDFNTGLPDKSQKFDVLTGFKIGVIIPIYKRRPEAFYVN
ncbi:MAG: hypothetical protein WCP69_02525 [Bacteroidota bacterium]